MDLPLSQLDSLKFKANQIIESIVSLQRTIDGGGLPAIPPWPDILSKYNIILSQTHNFSNTLLAQHLTVGQGPSISSASTSGPGIGASRTNAFERIALHPCVSLSDAQLDNDVIPLLRNQQTTDVLRLENDSVRRLAERMTTRGSLGVLGAPSSSSSVGAPVRPLHDPAPTTTHRGKVEYDDVLRECAQIRDEHDKRVERAVRAVAMLRDKFDWKQRVEVEVEEPEELEWDPRIAERVDIDMQEGEEHGIDVDAEGEGEPGGDSPGGQSSDEDDVELVEHAVRGGSEPTTPAMPSAAAVEDGERVNVPAQ